MMERGMSRTLFVGLGDVGGQIFDLLVRTPGRHTFLVAGRDLEALRQRTNLARFAALQLGHYPDVLLAEFDLQDVEQTAEAIARFQPDMIFCAATLQKWSVLNELPPNARTQLYQAQLGPWLPAHLLLVYKLMQAVQQAGVPAIVVNATYPDVINSVLSQVGLAPLTGVGDLANNIPALRLAVAAELGVLSEQVEVRLIAHHYVSYWMHRTGAAGDAPFRFQALVDGVDVTSKLRPTTLFRALAQQWKRCSGSLMTAASAAIVFDGLVNDTGKLAHVPGPNGLPGGYPVRVSYQKVQVDLPAKLTLERAISINLVGQQRDGIDHVDEDGTVYFSERNMAILKELLGYECVRMPLVETEERAKELLARYAVFVKQCASLY
jgi:hypothetical protein